MSFQAISLHVTYEIVEGLREKALEPGSKSPIRRQHPLKYWNAVSSMQFPSIDDWNLDSSFENAPFSGDMLIFDDFGGGRYSKLNSK